MAYKMKTSIPSLCSSPLQNNDPKKRGRLHIENIDGIKNKNTAEQFSDNSNLRVNENFDTNDSFVNTKINDPKGCLLYTSPSPRDSDSSRMPSSA